jgi:hypothetical protein
MDTTMPESSFRKAGLRAKRRGLINHVDPLRRYLTLRFIAYFARIFLTLTHIGIR